MRLLSRSLLVSFPGTALLALALGCSTASIAGCGGSSGDQGTTDQDTGAEGGDETLTDSTASETTPPADSAAETSDDTTVDDSGTVDSTIADSGTDSGATETATDSSTTETAGDSTADSATTDTGATDSAVTDSVVVDSVVTDTAVDVAVDTALDTAVDTAVDVVVDTGCTVGSACPGGQVCQASTGGPTCQNCTSDTQCAGATSGTICVGGTCQTGACVPKTDARCGGGAAINCCPATGSIGACVAPVSGRTTCCADADCSGSATLNHCDVATHTCQCPAPTPGTLYVAPEGSDVDSAFGANGSQLCPFKTITHAISKVTTVSTTIIAQKAKAGTTPTIYGAGCTGGVPCDATPILVPNTVTGALLIEGNTGTPSDVVVTGDGNAVFAVNTPFAGFLALTIVPTKKAVIGGVAVGGYGIVFDHTGSTGTVSNVTIRGTTPGAAVPGTGDGILLLQTASLPLGPNVIITQMLRGLHVTAGASARLTGAAGAPVDISNTGDACIRVASASAAVTPSITISGGASNAVMLHDCAGAGALVIDTASIPTSANSIDHLSISRSAAFPGTFDGIHLLNNALANVTNSRIEGVLGNGIVAEGSARLILASSSIVGSGKKGILMQGSTNLSIPGSASSIGASVIVDKSTDIGVHISGSATATITGLSSTNATGAAADGLRCDSFGLIPGTLTTVKVRSSIFLGNGEHGFNLPAASGGTGGCAADLGSAADVGNNVFNATTQLNRLTGLCDLSAGADVTPTSSFWSCGRAAGTVPHCASGSPASRVLCNVPGTDYNSAFSRLTVPPGQQCCSTYP